MLNDPRSHGLWEKSAPPPPLTERLAKDTFTEIAVVGAGYTGLSAALNLSERGRDVTVLEAVEIGFGAAGRSSGLVNAGLWVMPAALQETLGQKYGSRLSGLLRDSPKAVFDVVEKYNIACELKCAGTIHCGAGKSGSVEIRERARQLKAIGAPVRILESDETQAMTGTSIYPRGLLDLRAGTVQPLAYVRGLGHAATSVGTRIFTQSPVLGIDREGDGWKLTTPGGTVRAKWVLISTDIYTSHVFPELREEQIVLPMFHVATEPLDESARKSILPGKQAAWDTKKVLRVFRTDDAGRLIIGSIGALRGMGTSIHRNFAQRFIRSLFPGLGKVRLEHEWHGRIGMTNDHLPRLHAPAPNMIAVSGYNGRGIATGTVFGREIAKHISGELPLEAMSLPVSPVRRASFRTVREGYYELGAQIAHLPPAR